MSFAGAILVGITRNSIIQIAHDLGYTVAIAPLKATDIASADEIPLTGTAAEVVPVCEVDDMRIGEGQCSRITRHIQEQFSRIVSGQDAAYRHWLQPVYRARDVPA